jgi:ubiquitin carboxyl-terminal hydrolase 5/13
LIGLSQSGYELRAFITHMGTNTACGHYVCHIHKPGQGWVIFNDRKVAKSQATPFEEGYVYFYEAC